MNHHATISPAAAAPIVHIVDDDEAIRDALGFLLDVQGIAHQSWTDAEHFLLDYRDSMRGCVLLDVRMNGMTGQECHDLLLQRGCTMPVIFLTGHGDVPMAVEALRAGASHFIEKPPQEAQLLAAVREALQRDAAQQRLIDGQRAMQSRIDQLSPREREVMQLILDGRLNKQIADELDISMRTVEVHRANIFDKMGVRSAVELAGMLARALPA
ncbi:response regulator transcription factor [Viridibacterium curvum]|uniref:Response regulator n=1 Tax=Viridibacterium curvum TaxID=1101404 RepID=A0ABP9QTR9_9RHOO